MVILGERLKGVGVVSRRAVGGVGVLRQRPEEEKGVAVNGRRCRRRSFRHLEVIVEGGSSLVGSVLGGFFLDVRVVLRRRRRRHVDGEEVGGVVVLVLVFGVLFLSASDIIPEVVIQQ